MKRKSRDADLPIVGWREWVKLPDFGVAAIKVKMDSGARSSALHAFNIEPFNRDGRDWVRFEVHPIQRNNRIVVVAEAPLLEYRTVRSSGGHETRRPVVETSVILNGVTWPIELTLASRDAMGFRMLLGRQAIRGRFLVHAGRSFLTGIPLQARHFHRTPSKRRRKPGTS